MSELYKISGCENNNRKADVIFIHGLGGNAFETWRNSNQFFWPEWLGKEFPEVGVWSLGYAASPTKWRWFRSRNREEGYSMALPSRATQVLDLMMPCDFGKRPLFFICHSLGGLLAKQLLRKSFDDPEARRQQVAQQTRALLFLATPHFGAKLASFINAFKKLFGATVTIEELCAHDANLNDLNDWYRTHATSLGIHTVTFYEQLPVNGVLPIVNLSSAHPGVGTDPVPLDEDHLSIAKPSSGNDHVCGSVCDLLRNHVLVPRSPSPTEQPPKVLLREPQEIIVKLESAMVAGVSRIPHELPPAAEEFFGRKSELDQLTDRLKKRKNTAVVGWAGLGKTALAAQAVLCVTGAQPAQLSKSPYPDGVLYFDLYTSNGQAEPVWNALANKVAGYGFLASSPPKERATEACRSRRILFIIEGGEEADGKEGRCSIHELFSVLSPENRWLLLTRLSVQAAPAESVELKEALHPDDAANLFDSLCKRRVSGEVRDRILALLDGHPLAITWAGNLVARNDEDPDELLREWEHKQLPLLSDPAQASHTLEWLFSRSVRRLDSAARRALEAAGLLAHAPFPLSAIEAALSDSGADIRLHNRDMLRSLVQCGLLRRSAAADYWQFTHVLGYRFARHERGSDLQLRRSLGVWMQRHLSALLDYSEREGQSFSVIATIEHAAALLRADSDQKLWFPLANYLLYDVVDRLTNFGRLDLVQLVLGAVADWFNLLPYETLIESDWQRECSALLNLQANVFLHQGDLEGALKIYKESREVSERLAKSDPSNATWQRDLSVSLDNIGEVLSAQGDLEGALKIYKESREVSERLAKSDPSNATWQRDLSVSLDNIGEVLSAQGGLEGALKIYKESREVRERLAKSDPSNATWQRDLSVSQNKIGEVLSAQGDLEGALKIYKESREVSERLAKSDPSNATWQRDLSVSQNKIGEVLSAQGDLEGALKIYKESREVRERLAKSDPSNATWQRDLSVSQNKIGEVLSAQGGLEGALKIYKESREVRERLAKSDPSNATWQRDLSVSLDNIGNVLSAQGDLEGALKIYKESREMSERLAKSDPSNAMWQRDLSVSQNKIGEVLSAQGDLEGALKIYKESREVSERLAKSDPSNATWQRDLSVSLDNIGNVLSAQGDLEGALKIYKESREVSERLAKSDPSNATWQRDLSVSQNKIGEVLSAQGDLEGALKIYKESREVRERLAKSDPSNATWQRDLSVSLDNIGEVLSAQGGLEGALKIYKESREVRERLAKSDPSNATWQRDLSYSFTSLALCYEKQGNLSEARHHAEESLAIDERLSVHDPTNAVWKRDVAFSRTQAERLRNLADKVVGLGENS